MLGFCYSTDKVHSQCFCNTWLVMFINQSQFSALSSTPCMPRPPPSVYSVTQSASGACRVILSYIVTDIQLLFSLCLLLFQIIEDSIFSLTSGVNSTEATVLFALPIATGVVGAFLFILIGFLLIQYYSMKPGVSTEHYGRRNTPKLYWVSV